MNGQSSDRSRTADSLSKSADAESQEHERRSHIQFVDGQTLEPRTETDIGNVLLSSQNLDWKGIHIETGENDGFYPNNLTVLQHYFAMNIGQPYQWEWKDGDRFKTEYSETGSIWINPAGVPFSHRISGYNQFALLALNPGKLLEGLPIRTPIDHQAFKQEHHSQDPQIQHLMNALVHEAAAKNPNGQLYVELLSQALSIHYVNHYSLKEVASDQVDLSSIGVDDRRRIGRVIDYIEAFISKDISLTDLALVAGRSKFHFSRLFKAAVGITPHQYLMKRRVERATYALKNRSLSIADVALTYGFADQTHFTRNFKKMMGITPGEFRREGL